MQDPTLGRFISADPIVQAPDFSQSWNRYAYVFNNPLSYVDPSGFQVGPDTPSDGGLAPSFGHRVGNSRDASLRFLTPNQVLDGSVTAVPAVVPIEASTISGAVSGARNFGTAARPYTLEEPVELAALRRAHPELDRATERIWVDSFRGARHEEGLLVYRSGATGRLLFNTTTLVPDGDSELTWANPTKPYFPHYRGYTLVLTVHTHPFQMAFGSNALQCRFVRCVARGPSDLDIATSTAHPHAMHMILAVGYRPSQRETYYYGDRANIER